MTQSPVVNLVKSGRLSNKSDGEVHAQMLDSVHDLKANFYLIKKKVIFSNVKYISFINQSSDRVLCVIRRCERIDFQKLSSDFSNRKKGMSIL